MSKRSANFGEFAGAGKALLEFSDGAERVSAPVGGGAIESHIPILAVGFVGYERLENLQARVLGTEEAKRPDAVLILNTGGYFCPSTGASGLGAGGIFSFCTKIASLVFTVLMATPDFRGYFEPYET